ncbi:hypothetical protein J2S30_002563 [Herbaspirillum rubrisubalbicans]|nr:hypothetical protein [Herbaspirillum rubrisubalbicans]
MAEPKKKAYFSRKQGVSFNILIVQMFNTQSHTSAIVEQGQYARLTSFLLSWT